MNKRIKKKKGFYKCPQCNRHMRYGIFYNDPRKRWCGVIHKGEKFTISPSIVKFYSVNEII